MTVVTARIQVAENGTISGRAPAGQVPPGEHMAAITVATAPLRRPGKPFIMENFPIDDGPWDDSISLRREDMYGDDGR
jgi:hypothetical protein